MAEKSTYEELEKRVHELEGSEFERKQVEKKIAQRNEFQPDFASGICCLLCCD